MTVTVIRGDARNLPLPDASVDLVVTSPPYFGLRAYTDGGDVYPGQIGSEATPAEWLTAMLACTREWVRVLKPSGSLFVNLGDKYSQRVATRRSSHQDGLFPDRPELVKDWKRDRAAGLARMPYENVMDLGSGAFIPEKSLMGLPWRYALACIDELGLILRAEIVWAKPNGLPESVTDRVRRSHENWFHLTREPRYYSAVDRIREQYAPGTAARYAKGFSANDYQTGQVRRDIGVDYSGTFDTNPLGKLPGSVWTIPSEPLAVPEHLGVDHFAAFPSEWPRRIIQGWSPERVCTVCGEGLRPVANAEREHVDYSLSGRRASERVEAAGGSISGGTARSTLGHKVSRTITGERCACDTPGPTVPGRVLDPFGGTGTTALVADVLGRDAVSVDLSYDYCRLARWRTTDPAQRAKAMRVERPPVQVDGQADLFGEVVA